MGSRNESSPSSSARLLVLAGLPLSLFPVLKKKKKKKKKIPCSIIKSVLFWIFKLFPKFSISKPLKEPINLPLLAIYISAFFSKGGGWMTNRLH
jgi:hypothetical protein